MAQEKRLDKLLVSMGLATEEQITDAKHKAMGSRRPLQDVLVEMGFVSDKNICQALAQILNMPPVDLSNAKIDQEVSELIPYTVTQRYSLVPLKVEDGSLVIAMTNPMDIAAIDEVGVLAGMPIKPVLASRSDITAASERLYHVDDSLYDMMKNVVADEQVQLLSDDGEHSDDVEDLRSQSEMGPIVRLASMIISDAIKMDASDIHIEAQEKKTLLRYRVDGILKNIMDIPANFNRSLVSRIKIMASLDIAERRIPQDGRTKVQIGAKTVDLRVSTLPTYFGEKVVMRILDTGQTMVELTQVGFSEAELELYDLFLNQPQGIILITGPTGSGKTCTLYASLNRINDESINIVTVEDPVEFQVEGLNQVQVNPKAGLVFATALRSFLRQDPDVILLGEIRDMDAAEIAMAAAMTGHLVFSTLHTNDAPSAVTRLIDIGVEAYLVGSCLVGVLAQRLVRRVCTNCKEEYQPDTHLLDLFQSYLMGVERPTFVHGKGCERCNFTGYKGRTAIFQILEITDEIRDLISQGANDTVIGKAARKNGMKTLAEAGLAKVLAGITTVEEVARNTSVKRDKVILCPSCQEPLKKEFKVCPHCSTILRMSCSFCNEQLEPGWASCPYCGHEVVLPGGKPAVTPKKAAGVEEVVAKGAVAAPRPVVKKPAATSTWFMSRESFSELLTEEEVAASEREKAEQKPARLKILAADDEAFMRELVVGAFENEPFEVITATNGEEALSKAHTESPDIIISDIDMPKMDGFELCKKLRSRLQTLHIPIILLTARTDIESELTGREAGADDYVSKPFDPHKLVSRTKMLLEKAAAKGS